MALTVSFNYLRDKLEAYAYSVAVADLETAVNV